MRQRVRRSGVPGSSSSMGRLLEALRSVLHVAFHRFTALVLLILFAPLILGLVLAIRQDSPGPAFFRCERVGLGGRTFRMLKFRKMWDGATGAGLTAPNDDRLTRLGAFLAASKLDELPQLWNVLRGDMNLVGPRPEAPEFVQAQPEAWAGIATVRPGITGLSQLAFRREGEILDPSDRVTDYLDRLLPQKLSLDALYAARRSFMLDVRILGWTVAAVVLRQDVAVHRATGRLSLRRRPVTKVVSAAMRAVD